MARTYKRFKTDYPGVVFRETDRQGKVYYIRYKRPGERKIIEDKLTGIGWTPAKANSERTRRLERINNSNSERRAQEKAAKDSNFERPTLERLWVNYLKSKEDTLRGIITDKNRWKKHIKPEFGKKTPEELTPLEIEHFRMRISKDHEIGTVRNILELMRRVINFGVKMRFCPKLDWTIEIPKPDPDSERIEVLTTEQLQNLNSVWETYHDRHIVNWHKLMAWTGMRPSEPLRLEWKDIDFDRGFLLKRKTKSNKTVQLQMNEMVTNILKDQRKLLDNSSEIMSSSKLVFPNKKGGIRRRDSYQSHFTEIRKMAGIPDEYRPNYCLRDTVASLMLGDGATLDEVGYQLGHEIGSPMTKRYAKYIPDAQRRIVNQSEKVISNAFQKLKVIEPEKNNNTNIIKKDISNKTHNKIQTWKNHIDEDQKYLLRDAALELGIKPYQLINNMRLREPKPLKVWIDFPKKYGEWFIKGILINRDSNVLKKYNITGTAFVPASEMLVLEKRLNQGLFGKSLLYDLGIIPEGFQDTLSNAISRSLSDEIQDNLESPNHSGIIRIKEFDYFLSPALEHRIKDFMLYKKNHTASTEQVNLILSRSDFEILKKKFEQTNKYSLEPIHKGEFCCILWKDNLDKLKLLSEMLYEQKFIESPSIWMEHFSTDALEKTDAIPINWIGAKYKLQYLLKNLACIEIKEKPSVHFKDLKAPPWTGDKPTHDYKVIREIINKIQ